MTKQVTVNIFDIEWDERRGTQKLGATLDEFDSLPLQQRWRDDIRLERVQRDVLLKYEIYKLDFVKKRVVGPGRISTNTPIQGIKMEENEDFGEETAAFYIPKKRWLLVLHNQAGIGPSRMMAYFNAIDPGNMDRYFNYTAQPKLDSAAWDRLKGMNGITAVSVTATMEALANAETDGETSIAAGTRKTKPKRISFQLMANETRRKGSFLDRVSTQGLIKALLKNGEEVTKLQVSGESPEVAGKDMVIDLLHHKIKRKFSSTDLAVVDHRWTLQSRWELLDRSFRGWTNSLSE
jgi:hypothetical protein